jgi:hypothetical protein
MARVDRHYELLWKIDVLAIIASQASRYNIENLGEIRAVFIRFDGFMRDWARRLKRYLTYRPERHYLRGRPSQTD